MWRNNVLGLRTTSSIAAFRNHGLNRTRWYGSSPSLPIADSEFLRALEKVLGARWDPASKAPVGFAISGGVDSMALATLYARARKNDNNLPPAHGFIVDHRARPESAEEADWVAEQLRQTLDMESTILRLQWPKSFDFSDMRRFETEARRLRYQALGTSCRDRGIISLMVAHHADDQAETVLMRLSNNRLRSGLQAMRSVEWIPECEGIHGVYHSGKPRRVHLDSNVLLQVEEGGIQTLRPLLGFEKARLIATCEGKDIPWAEDTTNQVQTLTARNAIRHIYRNHKLPEALSAKNLVNVSLHMQKRIEAHKVYAEGLFDQCLLDLNLQTGSVLVQFPPFSALLDRAIETDSDRNEARNNAYYLIKGVAELVSPRPSAPLDTLAATISNIFPEIVDAGSTSPPNKSYCVSGIWWRACGEPSRLTLRRDAEIDLPHPREWFLMRQLPSTREQKTASFEIIYPPSSKRPELPTGQWQLFDGRFWIRLTNFTHDTLTLRLFTASDRHHITAAEQGIEPAKHGIRSSRPDSSYTLQHARWLCTALSLVKPHALQYTLPAIFRRDSTTGGETLVGFPTLHEHVHGHGAPEYPCSWSVWYKKVHSGRRQLEEIVGPGISIQQVLEGKEKKKKTQVRGMGKNVGRGGAELLRGRRSDGKGEVENHRLF